MKYLLDTNACISYLNNSASPVRSRIFSLKPSNIFICSVVKAELFYGVLNSGNPKKNMDKLNVFLNQIRSLPFDDDSALIFGNIRTYLARIGKPIGPYDLQIAAIALQNNLTLVTHNISEFSRVPDLICEDWEI
jgi:tRNA(fMet)-specific endonuclease VapC